MKKKKMWCKEENEDHHSYRLRFYWKPNEASQNIGNRQSQSQKVSSGLRTANAITRYNQTDFENNRFKQGLIITSLNAGVLVELRIERRDAPAGVGDRGDAGEGAVEEDGEEGSRADVDWEGADDVIVLGNPVSEEIAFWSGASVTESGKGRR